MYNTHKNNFWSRFNNDYKNINKELLDVIRLGRRDGNHIDIKTLVCFKLVDSKDDVEVHI